MDHRYHGHPYGGGSHLHDLVVVAVIESCDLKCLRNLHVDFPEIVQGPAQHEVRGTDQGVKVYSRHETAVTYDFPQGIPSLIPGPGRRDQVIRIWYSVLLQAVLIGREAGFGTGMAAGPPQKGYASYSVLDYEVLDFLVHAFIGIEGNRRGALYRQSY